MYDRQFSTNMEFHHYLQRAKVYKLNDEGKWDDKGTGHVAVEYLERSETVGLVVLDEQDNKTLLLHRISADDIYRRTEEHIIAWKDPEVATNLALSFQDTMGCSYIWDHICSVQRSVHFPAVGALDAGPRSANEVLEHLGTSQSNDGVSNELVDLPAVELASLPEIAKILTDASVSFLDRDQIGSLIIKDPNFLRKLVELFSLYEDLENIEGLHLLFKIAKAIISLNDGRILDIILSDKYIMDIIGMLEYDPDVAVRQNHRSFLKEHVMFKQVVPIEDSSVLAKIHQTYKIGYIKDVIMPNVLDNQTFASMNTMILANNVSVVSTLLHNKSFIKNLFTELKSPRLSKQAKKDLVHFLQEFCSLTNLQQHSRMLLFDALVREGLLDVVTDLLGSDDESLRLSGTDILIVVLNFDSTILRKFLIHKPGNTLFSYLVTGMLTPGQGGAQAQLLEVMRMVLDCEVTERLPDMGSFLDVFYDKYMEQILDVLVAGTSSKGTSNLKQKGVSQRGPTERPRNVSPEILGNICELLCFCVQHHANRIKYYMSRKQVIEKVTRLTTRREKYLVVAAVRFLRTCVGRKDEFYYGCIVKQNLFEPVVQAFLANGSRYNLLNSAFLELIEFIVKENIKSLIVYLVEKYNDRFENIQYVETFKKLKLKYDQVLEGMPTREQESGAVRSKEKGMYSHDRLDGFPDTARRRKDDRALDKDEEEYFNEDSDDEEDTASVQTTMSAGKLAQAVIVNGGPLSALVDYEDEEEELPTLVMRNNGSDRELELHADGLGLSPSCSNKEPSVWLDREEDKMIQNLKRKSLSTSNAETDIELQKRRRSSMEPMHPTEEEVRLENPLDRSKPETSSRQVEKSLSTGRVERSCVNCTDKDSKSTTAKAVCTLSSPESGGAADNEIANKASEKLTPGTNGTGSLVEIHGVAGS